ncbi:hypothetical protein KS461_17750 [Pseudomonas chlororaphis]|uniref:hypothetical protein n=1 Tax=Pseudomonas chlororaphis TaxID=587753 RepID=UPI00215B5228|nr:hypothetical protein [Pseudomonas chlororaphis]UVE43268.1 hypothetical protein KS461_17750 [Pseudomonas chlororaphis]
METSFADLLSSSTQGAYRINTLLTRIGTDGDLEPEHGEPFTAAIALHVHEYIHSLHNLSTDVGFELLYSSLVLLPAFVTKTDEHGHFHAEADALGMNEQFDFWATITQALRGTSVKAATLPKTADSWCFSPIRSKVWNVGLDTKKAFVTKGLNIIVTSAGCEHEVDISNIGFDFLTEGVAYEVDREVRRNSGVPEFQLDLNMPLHPYLSYRKVVDHLIGRESSAVERIKIGVCALLTPAPSNGFFEACEAVHSDAFEVFEALTFKRFRESVEGKIERVEHLMQFFPGDDVMAKGFSIVLRLVWSGLNVRRVRPYLELEFLKEPLSSNGFKSIVARMQDHCVLQQKPEGKIDFYWGGSDVVEVDDSTLQCLGAFQASLYFTQLHLDAEARHHSTGSLPESKCPFKGACAAEEIQANPELCSVAPWKQYMIGFNAKPGEQGCWYGVGVRALARKTNRGQA